MYSFWDRLFIGGGEELILFNLENETIITMQLETILIGMGRSRVVWEIRKGMK